MPATDVTATALSHTVTTDGTWVAVTTRLWRVAARRLARQPGRSSDTAFPVSSVARYQMHTPTRWWPYGRVTFTVDKHSVYGRDTRTGKTSRIPVKARRHRLHYGHRHTAEFEQFSQVMAALIADTTTVSD